MKVEDQVTSLELSKRLKELGIKQDSLFYWINPNLENGLSDYLVSFGKRGNKNDLSAFTVAEVGILLPDEILLDGNILYKNYFCGNSLYSIAYSHPSGRIGIEEFGNNEVEVRSKMLIYLIKKGIIKICE